MIIGLLSIMLFHDSQNSPVVSLTTTSHDMIPTDSSNIISLYYKLIKYGLMLNIYNVFWFLMVVLWFSLIYIYHGVLDHRQICCWMSQVLIKLYIKQNSLVLHI